MGKGWERKIIHIDMDAFFAAIEQRDHPEFSLERYMKCGFGLCGNCAVDSSGMRLCVGGPVVKNELARTIT
ncbi:MAG: hypothetical protein PHS88_04925, partial [Candidatus Omnitrophica bacterium]|nr:hypothetical protein [Candidatus Omnitrophota bacterium]